MGETMNRISALEVADGVCRSVNETPVRPQKIIRKVISSGRQYVCSVEARFRR